MLYWNIGNIILRNQEIEGWGSKVIFNLSKDLKSEFTNLKGFSERNLKYMRKFADEYNDIEFMQQVVVQKKFFLSYGKKIFFVSIYFTKIIG